MSTWLLVILLYAPDSESATRVERSFPTWELCRAERDHLASQALPAGVAGRIVTWCESRL